MCNPPGCYIGIRWLLVFRHSSGSIISQKIPASQRFDSNRRAMRRLRIRLPKLRIQHQLGQCYVLQVSGQAFVS